MKGQLAPELQFCVNMLHSKPSSCTTVYHRSELPLIFFRLYSIKQFWKVASFTQYFFLMGKIHLSPLAVPGSLFCKDKYSWLAQSILRISAFTRLKNYISASVSSPLKQDSNILSFTSLHSSKYRA